MGSEFLEEIESNIHKQAKEKLFNMISNGLIIYDQYNCTYTGYDNYVRNVGRMTYERFLDIYEDHFLHMESPILNYKNSVLYSNKKTKLPCYKYLKFNYTKNKELLCKQKGIYGNIEYLPCKECIIKNYNDNNLNIGFIPDIAYGCNGKHISWIEINYTHSSTLHKLYFCYKKDIMLFEFDADYILNLDSNIKKLKAKRFNIISDDKIIEKQIITKYILESVIDNRLSYEIADILTERKLGKDKKLQQHFQDTIKNYNIDVAKLDIKDEKFPYHWFKTTK